MRPRNLSRDLQRRATDTPALRQVRPRPARNPRGGSPPFVPSAEQRHQAETLASFGLPAEQIRQVLLNPATGRPISRTTLERCFRDELDRGRARASAAVAQNLFRLACGSGRQAVTAAIWWTRARMGWRGNHLRATPVQEVAPCVDLVDAKERLWRLIERERSSRSEEEGKP